MIKMTVIILTAIIVAMGGHNCCDIRHDSNGHNGFNDNYCQAQFQLASSVPVNLN